MAVTPTFLKAWIAEHGPWVYHIARSSGVRDRILSDGLMPPELSGKRGSYAGEETEARPGHIYLCTAKGFSVIADQSFGPWSDLRRQERIVTDTIAVDLRGLDVTALSPDEDCCFESYLTLEMEWPHLPSPGAYLAEDTVRDPYLPSAKHETPEDFTERPYRSFGAWAEAQNVGSCPEHTATCWQTFGSLAHRGPIAAHLLCQADTEAFRTILGVSC